MLIEETSVTDELKLRFLYSRRVNLLRRAAHALAELADLLAGRVRVTGFDAEMLSLSSVYIIVPRRIAH